MSIWFYIFLLSAVCNTIALYYVRWLLKSVVVINEDIINLNDLITEFSEHLKSVHDMEMFYGDQTLTGLIDHSRGLLEKISDLDLIINNEDNDEEEA